MAKFLFVYRDPAGADMQPSAEDIQAALAQWGAWLGKFAQKGNILDGGDGLKATGRVMRCDGVVSDGPFVESKEVLGGYSIIQAETYEEALEVARECPCLMSGGSIEIREFAGYT